METADLIEVAQRKAEEARQKVFNLCDGKERWTMSVPVREDDHDTLFCDVFALVDELASRLRGRMSGAELDGNA